MYIQLMLLRVFHLFHAVAQSLLDDFVCTRNVGHFIRMDLTRNVFLLDPTLYMRTWYDLSAFFSICMQAVL